MNSPGLDPQRLNRRHVGAWALYDFANSVYPAVIQVAVFSVYYATAVVGNDAGQGDALWTRAVSLSALVVAMSSPLLGSIADRAGVRKRLMMAYTFLCVISVSLFVTIEPGMVMWGFVLAVLANVGFEGALVFYNAYLPDLAPKERQGFVSGLGFGIGYAGSVAGLLMALPLALSERYDLVWLSVAGFFALFSLPTFLALPADREADLTVREAAREGLLGFRRIVGEVWAQQELRRFLFAFFFYIDGVLTVIATAGLFAEQTLGFEISDLIRLFLVVQVSALVGALVMAKPTDKVGAKPVISVSLVLWVAVAVSGFFVQDPSTFFLIAVLAGFGLGTVQAASRSLMASLIPEGKEAEMFGFYAFCGKSSSVLGPLVFGTVSYGTGNQRLAVLSIAAFFLIGLLLLQRVHPPGEAPPPSLDLTGQG
ncbi:MAG: MFS transporter [Gemmatimonadetes bacterium]|nr:MFS transporter [Gemmatimonadota bacterium]